MIYNEPIFATVETKHNYCRSTCHFLYVLLSVTKMPGPEYNVPFQMELMYLSTRGTASAEESASFPDRACFTVDAYFIFCLALQ